MLKIVDGWDPIIQTAMKFIPPETLIDWKLLWRDPVRPWVSANGRIVTIGDAAHPHLPTSGQGAGQSLEDAATIGALIDKLGVDNIPNAFRALEKIR
jgi:2-polyprenyl-6-methoxyphenol hydroxylase-like FAD-dependent oxidoreductase